MTDPEEIEVVGNYGATLSLIEIGLGSFLHGFHVPFAGVFLSLNQGFLLTRASLDHRSLKSRWVPYQISNIAAVLKSFAPAGKKLGPMLSLSIQGLLFNLGSALFGKNIIGLSLGMVALSLWGFCQPILTYYLFFGENLFRGFHYMLEKTVPFHGLHLDQLLMIFLTVVILKALVGIALVIFAFSSKKGLIFQERLLALAKSKTKTAEVSNSHPVILALKDMLKPLFIVSILLTGLFLYFTEHQSAEIFWMLLRPLGIGFIFFYISRTLTIDRWLGRLEKGRWSGFAHSAQKALSKVRSTF